MVRGVFGRPSRPTGASGLANGNANQNGPALFYTALELKPEELQALCIKARAEFYSIPNILRRFRDPVNRSSPFMARQYPLINWMMRREVRQRDDLPLGDEGWNGRLGHACGQV